jgi:hypothetical protein
MDAATKIVTFVFAGFLAGVSIWQAPAEPGEATKPGLPITVYQPYEYGERAAGAEMAALAPSSPVDAPNPVPATETLKPLTTCSEAAVLALAAGLPHSELDTALKVAVRESRCTSDAYNAYDPMGGSYGIYQINGFWCRPSTYWPTGWLQAHGIADDCEMLFDPWVNTKAMLAIWSNSGWSPWHTAND